MAGGLGERRVSEVGNHFHVLVIFEALTDHFQADAGNWNVGLSPNDRWLARIQECAIAVPAKIVDSTPGIRQAVCRVVVEHSTHVVKPAEHPLRAVLR